VSVEPTAPPSLPAARIYDVRYSRYDGGHEPRRRAVLALALSSGSRALGLRKSTGAKVWPFLLLAAAYLPVIAAVGLPLLAPGGLSPQEILRYDEVQSVTLLVVVAFAATTLPSLLTRERRDRVLSLYFSTAVSPAEYLAGKVLAAVGLLLLVGLGPLLVLFLGTVLTAESPLQQLRSDGGDLPAVLAAGVVVALYYAALGLTAGSLTGKRVFAVGGLLAVLLVTPVIAGLTYNITGRRALLALDLASPPLHAAATILPGAEFNPVSPPGALAWAVCGLVLLVAVVVLPLRYTRGEQG
jgi:ABC-2 type transport system permease protein